jgi:hypothetical protein
MCSDSPGSSPIEIPKREAFSLRGSKKERKEMTSCGLGRRKEATGLSLRVLGPTSAQHARIVRDAPHGQSARCADGPAPRRGRSVIRSRTSRTAPLPLEPRGQSASPWRTVRQERMGSPAHLRGPSGLPFLFQLDIFRDKDLKKYLLGSLLKNYEGNLTYDAIYQLMLAN